MDFLVFVKQVPDTNDVEVDEESGTIIREGVESILNPFDEYALNLAIRLKEETDEEVEITAISMGPPQAKEALRKCLAIGADRAILLSDKAFAGADTWATSCTLFKAVEKLGGADLYFTGQEATDGNTAQVGPEMASNLNISPITYVEEVLDFDPDEGTISVRKETDQGYMKVQGKLPLVLSCMTPPDFEPRIPGVKEIMAAKKKPMETWGSEELEGSSDQFGLEGSESQVISTYPPSSKGPGEKFEGTPEEEATKILQRLESEGFLDD